MTDFILMLAGIGMFILFTLLFFMPIVLVVGAFQ